jgi:cell division protein ZapA (FtsZ GTPase activity inhibitor)
MPAVRNNIDPKTGKPIIGTAPTVPQVGPPGTVLTGGVGMLPDGSNVGATVGNGNFWYDPVTGAYTAGPGMAALTPEQQASAWYGQGYQANQDLFNQNNQSINFLSGLSGQTQAADQQALNNIFGQIDWQDSQNVNFNNQTAALLGQLGTATNNANAFDWGNLGNYQSQIAATNASNNGYMSGYTDVYNQLINPMTSTVTAQPVTSQAAQAYANPQDIANQYAAQAQLAAIANGSLDIDPMSVPGMRQLQGVANGSLDLKPGQLDPAAYAAAQDAMGKFKELSTPEVTDAERFIYEQALQNQIMNDRANRQGVQSQLRQRGLSGAGQQIASTALANQQNSENALLTSLGANANAVQRAMAALQGYGAVSTNLNAQANQMGAQNQSTRSGALTNMTGIAANIENNNMNRQLSGAQSNAQMTTAMRNESFQEAYQRGQAADSTAMFNSAQSVQVSEFNNTFAQNDAIRRGNLAGQYAQAGIGTNQINLNNNTLGYNAGRDTNATTFGRTQSFIGAQDTANSRANQMAGQQTDRRIAANGQQIGINDAGYTRDAGIIGAGMTNRGNMAAATGAYTSGMAGLSMGQAQADQARKAAADQAERDKSKGLFGTPILSGNGILGIQGVPFL